jgi:hypothetical protein
MLLHVMLHAYHRIHIANMRQQLHSMALAVSIKWWLYLLYSMGVDYTRQEGRNAPQNCSFRKQ